MAADEAVKLMKRDELGVFLRDRGIPFSDRNKNDRLRLAVNALEKNLPLIPSASEDLATAEAEVNRKLTLEDGMIRLPNPRKMTAGWTSTYSFFPDTTRAEVEQYIADCSKSHGVSVEGSKSFKEGESLYLSGHVTGVEYHRISPNLNYCFIRATVCRQMAVTQDPYTSWVILHKKTGVIQSAYCTCPAGLRSFCKHVVGLLHFIVRKVEGGCNVACTSKPQEWHKPHKKGKKIQQPDFVKNIKIKKVKGSFDSTPSDSDTGKNRINFDPRALCHQGQKSLQDFNLVKLEEITGGNCGVLLYATRPEKDNHPVLHHFSVEHLNSLCLKELDTNIKAYKLELDLEEYRNILVDRMQLNDQQINCIADSTKQQGQSALWYHMREGRITSSIMKECMVKVSDNGVVSSRNSSFLGKVLCYSENIETKEMKWGKSMENRAIAEYKNIQSKCHDNFKVEKCGLYISQETPFIAGTPDATVSCKCCHNGVLEVKNPFSARCLPISEYVKLKNSCLILNGNDVRLKRCHDYYAQVQVEMYVTNSLYADFVVCTGSKTNNIHIERILPDIEFVQEMKNKSFRVFHEIIVPEMFERKQEHEHNLKVVEKVLSDMTDKVSSILKDY